MKDKMIRRGRNLPTPFQFSKPVSNLSEEQLNALTGAFQTWYDEAPNAYARKVRGRYWLVFLVLRYTAARLQEVLMLDDSKDINYREAELRLPTLKRHKKNERDNPPLRTVAVPPNVTSEISIYLADYPEMRGKVFGLQQSNFRTRFYDRCKEAKIPKELGHPHILRHTRGIEMVRGLVPATIVKEIMGHASLDTTAEYLRFSGVEAKQILKDRGMI